MIIRPMLIKDVDAVYQIECDCFSSPWSLDALKQEVDREASLYSVVTIDDKVVAYGGMRICLDEGEITNIAVNKNYRRTGIGRELFENLLEQAKKRHIGSITLEVRISNKAAKILYLSAGFKQIAIRKGYYQKPAEDAVIMQLMKDYK